MYFLMYYSLGCVAIYWCMVSIPGATVLKKLTLTLQLPMASDESGLHRGVDLGREIGSEYNVFNYQVISDNI